MAKCCIGIDLGGTFTKFALMDEHGKMTRTFQLPTPLDKGGQGLVDLLVVGSQRLMSENSLAADDVLGIGIGSPGPISIRRGMILMLPNIPGMENLPLCEMVSSRLHRPVVLENDGNAAAYGEYICGAGKGGGDMVMLTLGTGIGSGIIIEGRIHHGKHEIGAELGHMIVDADGELCNCGQRGCLERYSSATFLSLYAARLLQSDPRPSVLREIAGGSAIDARHIVEAYKQGDELATEVWLRAMKFLAIGCINICRIFDPDEIVLAGGLVNAGKDLLDPLSGFYHELHWKLTEVRTPILLARLGSDAGVIGAAGVAWSAVREVPDCAAHLTIDRQDQ